MFPRRFAIHPQAQERFSYIESFSTHMPCHQDGLELPRAGNVIDRGTVIPAICCSTHVEQGRSTVIPASALREPGARGGRPHAVGPCGRHNCCRGAARVGMHCRGIELDVDDEHDHDGGLALYEARAKTGTREKQAARQKAAQVRTGAPGCCMACMSFARPWLLQCTCHANFHGVWVCQLQHCDCHLVSAMPCVHATSCGFIPGCLPT